MDVKDCFICGYYDDSGNGDYIIECNQKMYDLYMGSLINAIDVNEFKRRLAESLGEKHDFILLFK